MYTALLSIWDKSPRTVSTYVSAIRSEYKILGVTVKNEFLLRLLKGVRSLNRGVRRKRLPILNQHLPNLVSQIKNISSPYDGLLYSAMTLLAFHCLLRVGEITDSEHNLRESGMEILARHLSRSVNLTEAKTIILLKFGSTKTDPYGEKEQFTWCATELQPNICPVRALYSYLSVRPSNAEFLFCPPQGLPIERKAFIRVLNMACALAIDNSAQYKSHSLRMGGAVYMLLSGWSMEQIMARGRWVTPEIAKKYCLSIQHVFQT